MVLHQDHSCRSKHQRALDDFANKNGGVVDGAGSLHFIGHDLILPVEEKNSQKFTDLKRLGDANVFVDDNAACLRSSSRFRRKVAAPISLSSLGNSFARAFHPLVALGRRVDHVGKKPKRASRNLTRSLVSRRERAALAAHSPAWHPHLRFTIADARFRGDRCGGAKTALRRRPALACPHASRKR